MKPSELRKKFELDTGLDFDKSSWIVVDTWRRRTFAVAENDDVYNTACFYCGTTDKSLQLIPMRNQENVTGLLMS